MGSASREALSAAKAALNGRLSKSAGTELLAAASQIGASSALLGALSDSSAAASAKSEVVERLFGGFSAGARSVLTAAVSQSWSNADEFVAGVEDLGLRALAISDADLADELLAAAGVIDSSHELELELGNKLGSAAAKVALASKVFSGKLSAEAEGVVAHLVANPRGRRISAALRESARIAADQGGTELATVTVASPLSPAQAEKLSTLLQQSAGRPVKVTTVVDPDLLGGVRIQIADDVIDGSVRARLDDLRQRLAA